MLLPVNRATRAAIVEADENWTVGGSLADDVDVVLWGRVPYRSMPARASSHIAARERALRALGARPPVGLRRAGLYRLHPPPGAPGVIHSLVRDFLYGGAVVELVRGARPPRIADVAAADAAVTFDEKSIGLGADRAAVIRAHRNGQELILRIAPTGAASDPAAAADALERLEAVRVQPVPRLEGRGTVTGANWALESVLPGRRPRKISGRVTAQALAFCGSLPSSDGPPSALGEELSGLARPLPERAGDLAGAWHRLASINDTAPAVLRHGDFWGGNLLVHRGRLSGVIDWDTSHPSSLPGIDVLHLFYASGSKRGRGRDVGDVWSQRPWHSTEFADFSRPYWDRIGFVPDEAQLEVIGAGWWTSWAHRVLRRHPRLLADPVWMRRNIGSVVDALAR